MLHVAIALGLLAGLGLGLLAAISGSQMLQAIALAVAPLGTAFMNAIRMVVIPLVMTVVFSGVARLGDPRKLGRLAGGTLVFFWTTIPPAILVGMGVMQLGLLFAPQVTMPEAGTQEAPALPGFIDFLVNLIPGNPFEAASSGALLPVIVFTALLAAAAGTLPPDLRNRLTGLADALSGALIKLVHWILWTAPVGIFGLSAPVTAKLGWGLLGNLAVFVVCVIAGLAVYLVFVQLPLVRFVGGIPPFRFLRGTFGGVAIGFSTTSTVAALPVMIEEAESNLELPPSLVDLVLPLGASMYRPGSALFQGAAIIFLAHLYGVPVAPAAVGGAILATFLVALTVAPVPSSSVVTLAPALETVGVPLSGMAILLGIDRIPDMFRTAVNSIGQITATVVMNWWAGGAPQEPPRQSS